jgi:hypothetical protein
LNAAANLFYRDTAASARIRLRDGESRMLDEFGFEALLGIAVIVGAALAAVALLYRFRWRDGRNPLRQEEIGGADGAGRLAVLESTEVDAERRLLLVRCDDIEHLIMVGGPTDIVIENDVRRRRAAAARPAAKPMAAEAVARPGRAEGEPSSVRELPRAEAPPAAAAQASPAAAERTEPLVARGPQQNLASAAAMPAGRNGTGAEATAEADGQRRPEGAAADANPRALLREQRRRARQAARDDEERAEEDEERKQPPSGPAAAPQPAQRDAGVPTLRPAAAPAPSPSTSPSPPAAPATDGRLRLQPLLGGRRDNESGARRDTPGRDEAERPREPPRAETPQPRAETPPARAETPPARADALPPAETPWSEPDSIENEIVRALRVEPQPPLSPMALPALPASARGNANKSTTDPGTTLGDLADRLEEALAREVQAANARHSRLDLDLGPFDLDRERETRDKGAPPAPKERIEPKLTVPASPEAEPRREPRAAPERTERQERPDRQERQERQEETPVISLNARRREPVDPLEDEMARLLGELTGDSNRR